MTYSKHKSKFPGFPPEPIANYWPYPKALNGWWHVLSPYEQKVLDYILRHTWGYKKIADSISHSQFIHGITRRDGKVVDRGTGIKDSRTLTKATKRLEELGFIKIERTLGRENHYILKINELQETIPPTSHEGSPSTNDGHGNYPHGTSNTIKDTPIKNNNIISAKRNENDSYKNEITQLISYLQSKLGGLNFPIYGKQAKYVKSILVAGYTVDEIKSTINKMLQNDWWKENSFDMKNVADMIPKIMSKFYKERQKILNPRPEFVACNKNGCDGGYISNTETGGIRECSCHTIYSKKLREWKEKYGQ